MNSEETRIEKKVMMTYFNIFTCYFPGGTEEHKDTLLKIGDRPIEVRTADHQNKTAKLCSNRHLLDTETFEEVRKC
jgi:hypothetical protein